MKNPLERIVEWLVDRPFMRKAVARHANVIWDRIHKRGGFRGGEDDRTTNAWQPPSHTAAKSDVEKIINMRNNAYDLWRNNSYARKAINAITAQVVGTGLRPSSLAQTRTKEPLDAFRADSEFLWELFSECPEFRSVAGAGCPKFCDVEGIIVREVILGGEVLIRRRFLTPQQMARQGKFIPYAIEIISGERLSDDRFFLGTPDTVPQDSYIYRGLEFNSQDEITHYWINDNHPDDPRTGATGRFTTHRVNAREIRHVYHREFSEDFRGVTWLAPVVRDLKDVGDYKENELVGAAVGACVALAITKQAGSVRPTLNARSGETNTDDDNNAITRMQPGMVMHLNEGESIEGFNPQRSAGNTAIFVDHMLQGTSSGLPGVKSSTLTANYKNSSFSSERSADNDAWRVTEMFQKWLSGTVHQPIWNDVIEVGIASGWFKNLDRRKLFKATTAVESNLEMLLLGRASWQGPVKQSINPKDDEEASEIAMRTGTSSLIVEAAARGRNWRNNLDDMVTVVNYAEKIGIPEEYINQLLGIKPEPPAPAPEPQPEGDNENDDPDESDSDEGSNEPPGDPES